MAPWIAAVIAGCGTSATEGSPAEDASVDVGDGGSSDGLAPVDGGAPVDADAACPAAPPAQGASCASPGLWCQYGDDPHARCAVRAYCNGGLGPVHWDLTPPEIDCEAAGAACPPSFATDAGACPPGTTARSCDYAEGRCACVSCMPADGDVERTEWTCRAWTDVGTFILDDAGNIVAAPPDVAACPPVPPHLGSACATSAICGYDSCTGVSLGWYEWCSGGTWAIGPQTDLCNLRACLGP
jgi:hypothetical protein